MMFMYLITVMFIFIQLMNLLATDMIRQHVEQRNYTNCWKLIRIIFKNTWGIYDDL